MEARLYESLFLDAVDEEQDFTASLNPKSLVTMAGKVEPSVAGVAAGSRFQFERVGYFCADPDSTPERPVFNRTVPLRDTWAKIDKSQKG